MHPKLKPIAAAIVLATFSSAPAFAVDKELDPVIVTASNISQKETEATFATEIHTRKSIEKTTAGSLYEYLSQYSSINVLPSYGNTAAPLLDMRGFGTGNGYQNIAISIDGRRLNNVDLASPLLASIPLETIERIEIVKGSGSVAQGDGATAGAILIFTKPQNGVQIRSSLGNYGSTQNSLNAGLANEIYSLQFSGNTSGTDGVRHPDATGHKDASMVSSQKISGQFNLSEQLRLSAEFGHTDVDTRYGGSITQAQFDANPAQIKNASQKFTHQQFNTDHWRIGAQYQVSPNLMIALNSGEEIKRSEYVLSTLKDYKQTQHDINASFRDEAIEISTGLQNYKGVIAQDGAETSKDNSAVYLQGKYQLNDDTAITAGMRREAVTYKSELGNLSTTKPLSAWDTGINYRLSPIYTSFLSYNQSYQAPDVDRFFSTVYDSNYNAIGRQFNGFIEPAHVKTVTVGLNRLTSESKTKIALFYARLENEIYLEPLTYKNTNIDKSHKYGLELQHFWKATENLSTNVNYSYVRSIIDEESDANGTYAGKDLPGVPRHSILASANYALSPKTDFLLSQMWRDRAYAANDFTNSFQQRQGIQSSTNLALRHRIEKNLELFSSVDNLFGHKNGIWIRDNAIYPISFTPLYKIGLRASF